MKVNGDRINDVVKGSSSLLMGIVTLALIKMVSLMAKGYTDGRMVSCMMESGDKV